MSDYVLPLQPLPRAPSAPGLYTRSLIIVIAPIVLLQTIMAGIILERHWDNVTKVLAARWRAKSAWSPISMTARTNRAAAIKEIEAVANKRLELGLEIARGDCVAGAD